MTPVLPPRPLPLSSRAVVDATLRSLWLALIALAAFAMVPFCADAWGIGAAAIGLVFAGLAIMPLRGYRTLRACAAAGEEVHLDVVDVVATEQHCNRLRRFTLRLPDGKNVIETFAKNFMWDDGGPLYVDANHVVALVDSRHP